MKNIKIVGMSIVHYIGEEVVGHNCDFDRIPKEMRSHILYGKNEERLVKISLRVDYGKCPSGWTTASWGSMKVEMLKRPEPFQYTPKGVLTIPDNLGDFPEEDIENDVFSVSYDGGDEWYPSGGYTVNEELFAKNPRAKSKRPVWIFEGKSGSGKTFLSGKLQDLSVYETDSSEDLPDKILADVVVKGNKYSFTNKQIIERLFGEVEVITVSFG